MKVLVFGASGKMGAAIGWDLAKEKDVETVGLAGRTEPTLRAVEEWIGSSKARIHTLDVMEPEATSALMKSYDVGVCALPDRATSYRLLDTAVHAGMDLVDILEEYHRRPDAYETEGLDLPHGFSLNDYGDYLHENAVKNSVTFLDGIGFAPGISNVMVGEGIRKLEKAENVIARVGGIPSKEAALRHPLRYMITWSFDHVLREYMVKLNVIKHGEVVEVDAGTDLEKFRFEQFGIDEDLECAITPGMPSFIYTRPELVEFAEKTVRWPGHWEGIQTLKEIGLLDLDPVETQGTKIRPRDFLLEMIEPKLKPLDGDTDVCVMWNSVEGVKDAKRKRVNSYMWDTADTDNNISSMARVTGFSAAIAAAFIGRGMIRENGIVPPEECFYGEVYEAFIRELAKRDIDILETFEDL